MKTLNLDSAAKLQQAEDEGRWMPLTDGGEALIAYARSEDFRNKLRALERRYRLERNMGPKKDIPIEGWLDLLRQAAVGTILKGVRGIVFEESSRAAYAAAGWILDASNELPWNEQNGLRLMRTLRSVHDDVMRLSEEREAFHQEFVAESEGF
jgi:hypothetical protein